LTLLRTPPGTKDVLPTEAAELRLIEDSLRTVFAEFGYGEVRTPVLEYEEVLALSAEAAVMSGFRMLDEHSNLLLLRPDLTPAIARLFGSRLRGGLPPHRVFVVSDVYRRAQPRRGQAAEFRQAGVELLGSGLPQADAEVLAVCCRGLDRASLRDYRVGVGQVAFFSELLVALGLQDEQRRLLTAELVDKDFVGFRLYAEGLGLSDADLDAVLTVPDLRGGPEVLERAGAHIRSREMEEALRRLLDVSEGVAAYGYGERLLYDLGIFRNLDYYTGLVFEIYPPDMGFTLGGGGRYDNLLARFGNPMSAVGFGIGLDRLHVALVEQGIDFDPQEPLVLMVGGLDRWVWLADRLRRACVGVFALPAAAEQSDLPVLGRQKDIPILVEPVPGTEGERWTVTDLTAQGSEGCTAADLVDVVCRLAFEHDHLRSEAT
jgi:ATP phosphoribosyltransferase regulatory subunit